MADAPRYAASRWALFALGLVISVVMVLRAQVELDQYVLIVRGWLLAREGWWVPFGALTAAGGFQPGGLTSLLMGAPLLIWEDHRAIGLATVAGHVVAYVLLDRALAPTLGARGRLLLCIVFWLNPWRVFYSAHVWNPNWLFLPAVVHLITALRSRRVASFWSSLLHVLAVSAALHLHASFLILGIASVVLWWRGMVKVHWTGFSCGAILGLASLVPWLRAVMAHPGLLPVREGSFGWGLTQVVPVLEGLAYWVRYPTAAISSKMLRFDFEPLLGEHLQGVFEALGYGLAYSLGPVSLLVAAAMNWWLWRGFWRCDLNVALASVAFWRTGWEPRQALPGGRPFAEEPSSADEQQSSCCDWLTSYGCWLAVAMFLVLALNPADHSTSSSAAGTTSWRGFVTLPAATVVVALWLERLLASHTETRRRWAARCLTAYALLTVALLGCLSVAAPRYRQGGERHLRSVLQPHAILEELDLERTTTVVIDSEQGFQSELLGGRESLDRLPPYPRM